MAILLNNIRVFLTHDYDVRATIIVDGWKEKHGYNKEVSCIITNGYTCHNVNDTFLLDRWWPCFLPQIGVKDVIPIVNYIELTF